MEAAVRAARGEELARADRILSEARLRCPGHPGVVRELAALRFRQGRLGEAGALALELAELEPESGWAWDLFASTRYLTDDPSGALEAWNRIGRPVAREVRVPEGAALERRAQGTLSRSIGIDEGRVLTPEQLVLGRRRLEDVPAISRARVDYRPLPEGQAAVEVAVTFAPRHPFTRQALPAHVVRAVGREVRLTGANALGRLEGWSLSGSAEASLRRVEAIASHPSPVGSSVLSFEIVHEAGRYATRAQEAPTRLARYGARLGVSHRPVARIRGLLSGGIDHWRERGTEGVREPGAFAFVGLAVTLHPMHLPGSLEWEGQRWVGSADGAAFGRTALTATAVSPLASRLELDVRAGLEGLSAAAPADLHPRYGADRTATRLMRARSALESDGSVRVGDSAAAWAHGGAELRAWGPTRLLTMGAAVFADAAAPLRPAREGSAAARQGAAPSDDAMLHLGAGFRARVPGVPGWLRADWAVDSADGASRFSAAWVGGG